MPNFVITFSRNVLEEATIIAEADHKNDAILAAQEILTESDFVRAEVEKTEMTVRRLTG